MADLNAARILGAIHGITHLELVKARDLAGLVGRLRARTYDTLQANVEGDFAWIESRAEGDRIDVSGIDADSGTAGDQAFSFVGRAAFSGAAITLACVRLITDPKGLSRRWGVILGFLYSIALMSQTFCQVQSDATKP